MAAGEEEDGGDRRDGRMAARTVGPAPGLWRRVIGHDRWAAGPSVEGVDKEAERCVMQQFAVE